MHYTPVIFAEYAAPQRYIKAVRMCVRSAWGGLHQRGMVVVVGFANEKLKHCGMSVTEAAFKLDKSRDLRL